MTTQTKPSTKMPTHTVYAVIDGTSETDPASWTPISGAWAHADGRGYSFSLGKLRLVLRPRKPKTDASSTEDLSLDAEVTL